jgi:glutamate racemase
VFDSGVGGLSVANALIRRLPKESILYLGDTARLPYGIKSADTVRRYSERNVDFLLGRAVKAVVVACNTASALALDRLDVPLPIWGVIRPGARVAAQASRGRVGVIATEATINSAAYARALKRCRPELDVFSRACGLFVPLVEEGWTDDPVTEQVARRYLKPLLAADIDTLVLGCTHYPILRPLLARIIGDDIALIDSAESVADTVAAAFEDGRLHPASRSPAYHLCLTDASERFERTARAFLDHRATFELVDV